MRRGPWWGRTGEEARAKGTGRGKGFFRWVAAGGAWAKGGEGGFTRLLSEPETHGFLGAALSAPMRAT